MAVHRTYWAVGTEWPYIRIEGSAFSEREIYSWRGKAERALERRRAEHWDDRRRYFLARMDFTEVEDA